MKLEDPLVAAGKGFAGMTVQRVLCRALPTTTARVTGPGLTAAGGALALGKGAFRVGQYKAKHEALIDGGYEIDPNNDWKQDEALMRPEDTFRRLYVDSGRLQ